MRRGKDNSRTNRKSEARARGLRAIGRFRRGESKTLAAAARAEKTTVETIRRLLPSAIAQDRRGGRIRVKASDRYSARVEILTDAGALVVTARGSRQRELAGRHRATYMRVLQGKEPPSALEQYRGKKVGGHELISDYARLATLAQAGVLGQLGAGEESEPHHASKAHRDAPKRVGIPHSLLLLSGVGHLVFRGGPSCHAQARSGVHSRDVPQLSLETGAETRRCKTY